MIPDDEFWRAFFALEIASSKFRHRDQLRLAWLAVRLAGWRPPDLVALPF